MNSRSVLPFALAVFVAFAGVSFSACQVDAEQRTSQWTNKEKQVVSRLSWARGQMRGFSKEIRSAKPAANTVTRGPLAVNSYLKILGKYASGYRTRTSRYLDRSIRILRHAGRNENAAERKKILSAVSENLLRLHKEDLSKMLNHIKGSPDARNLSNRSQAIVGKLNEAIRTAKAL